MPLSCDEVYLVSNISLTITNSSTLNIASRNIDIDNVGDNVGNNVLNGLDIGKSIDLIDNMVAI